MHLHVLIRIMKGAPLGDTRKRLIGLEAHSLFLLMRLDMQVTQDVDLEDKEVINWNRAGALDDSKYSNLPLKYAPL